MHSAKTKRKFFKIYRYNTNVAVHKAPTESEAAETRQRMNAEKSIKSGAVLS